MRLSCNQIIVPDLSSSSLAARRCSRSVMVRFFSAICLLSLRRLAPTCSYTCACHKTVISLNHHNSTNVPNSAIHQLLMCASHLTAVICMHMLLRCIPRGCLHLAVNIGRVVKQLVCHGNLRSCAQAGLQASAAQAGLLQLRQQHLPCGLQGTPDPTFLHDGCSSSY